MDPSDNTFSIHKKVTSTNFILDGSIDPYAGKSTSTNFVTESGDAAEFYCGDGFRDVGETCDGTDLNSATCGSQGFDSGTLTCSSACAYVTSACVTNNASGGGGGGTPAAAAPSKPTVSSELTSKIYSYKSSLTLYGGKEAAVTQIFVNDKTTGVTFPTATTWKDIVALSFGSNTFKIIAQNSGGSSSEATTYSIVRRLAGDVSGDNTVNDYDLSKIAKLWGSKDVSADFNEDGTVNDYDFSMMVARWGTKV